MKKMIGKGQNKLFFILFSALLILGLNSTIVNVCSAA